jgi:heme/copper-type cytochrome/quinol oxidase subunit 1
MSTLTIEQHLTDLWERPKTIRGWFATVDHKDLGIRYIVTAFIFLLVGGVEAFDQAPHGGWFAYMPYTGVQFSPTYDLDFYALSLIFLTISTTGGAINFIVTILRLRAPGMTISRMPLSLYSTLTVSVTILLALPALTVACVFMELDRRWGTHFFQVAGGGDPVLWQQIFWFFGHPWGLRHFPASDRNAVDDRACFLPGVRLSAIPL